MGDSPGRGPATATAPACAAGVRDSTDAACSRHSPRAASRPQIGRPARRVNSVLPAGARLTGGKAGVVRLEELGVAALAVVAEDAIRAVAVRHRHELAPPADALRRRRTRDPREGDLARPAWRRSCSSGRRWNSSRWHGRRAAGRGSRSKPPKSPTIRSVQLLPQPGSDTTREKTPFCVAGCAACRGALIAEVTPRSLLLVRRPTETARPGPAG